MCFYVVYIKVIRTKILLLFLFLLSLYLGMSARISESTFIYLFSLSWIWNTFVTLNTFVILNTACIFSMCQMLFTSIGTVCCGTDRHRTGEGELGALFWSLVKYNSDSTAKPQSPQWLTFLHMRIAHLFLLFPLCLSIICNSYS